MTAPSSAVVASGAAAILRERAKARAGRAELLLFRVGPEYFATALAASEEAIELPEHPVEVVPGRAASRLGVITLRGALLPLYTPRQALGLPPATELPAMAIVFAAPSGRVAIAVDEVEDVFAADLAELHETPGANRGALGVMLGALHHQGLLVGIIDAEALLGACRVELTKASAGASGPTASPTLALERT